MGVHVLGIPLEGLMVKLYDTPWVPTLLAETSQITAHSIGGDRRCVNKGVVLRMLDLLVSERDIIRPK